VTVFSMSYAIPSALESTRERTMLGLSGDGARPLRFHAKIARHTLSVRLALQTLGELIWRHDEWLSEDDRLWSLDPIATVHDDRVFFEALSSDQSAYGLVIVDREVFAPEGEVQNGTTNVDFTAWLWAALAEMRSSRETFFRLGSEGFEVATKGFGGRFEKKVEVPDEWVRGFLQLQGAMALPGTRLSVRPVDLLHAIRYLRYSKAKVSPRALRFEMAPDTDARLVLEPWEHVVKLRGASHGYTEPRTIRTWGRRRLSLLEPLLPFAEKVDVYLKGRALPSFYAVEMPGVTFVLGLSGWTSQRWTESASFDLLVAPGGPAADADKDKVLDELRARTHASVEALATSTGLSKPVVSQALAALCAEGRCLFDIETRDYRHRELFAEPIDRARIYPPDPRKEAAERYQREGAVQVVSAVSRETRKQRRLKTPDGPVFRELVFRDWVVSGSVGAEAAVELTLNEEDRLIFGRCGCAFFAENLLAKGPCEHLVALLAVAAPLRKEAQSSAEMDKRAYEGAVRAGAGRDDEDDGDDGDDDLDEDGDNDDDA
jgi:hypothetical protein